MVLLTIERARYIIDEIRVNNGGITAEDRRNTSENVLRALENLRRQLGSSTRALARDLYTSESRFVYELIQNAEDNSYSPAQNGDCYIKFTLTPENLVVENNELGFNEADVLSICKVGDSTKSNRIGFIGEKGIGFKSVFQVAQKVRIQSGPFDFYFEHVPSDTGMGMITPINGEEETEIYKEGTRMTLTLLQPHDFSKRSTDLLGIPDALILFLPKLQRIEVLIQRQNGDLSTTVHEKQDDGQNSTVRLVKRVDDTVSEKFFHVERRMFRDLPSNDARKNRDRAEVVLAFPIASNSNPIVEPQLTFSFLPIRNLGFKFLIQSDFITAASRQDVRQCDWNDALLQHVSDVFVDAVNKFCSRPVLQYGWLSFLPGTSVPHEFWNGLHGIIINQLAQHPILLTRRGVSQLPSRLQRLSERHCDKDGEPLFEDLQQEVYLSSDYRPEHHEYLQQLGVTPLSWNNIIARITPYLQDETPRFLHPDRDDDWHTRVADLLIRGLRDRDIESKIKELPLIPLRDGSIHHNRSKTIYFPTDSLGNHIPMDLDLQIVDDDALNNSARKLLYEKLEVQYCSPSFVASQIVKRYHPPQRINLADSVSHLKYLYQTLPDDEALNDSIFMMNQNKVPIYRKFVTFGRSIIVDDLYFDTNGDFGTRHLAQELKSNGSPAIHILHDAYLEAIPLNEEIKGRSWKQWLEKKALIRKVPRLQRSSTTGISPLFREIIARQPRLLVGLLKRYWSTYKSQTTDAIEEAICNAEVPCNGTDALHPLKAIYLPTPQLTRICQQSCVSDYFDLFVNVGLSSEESETGLAAWEFLKVFGVGIKPDINFFRDILSALTENISGLELKRGLFYVYEQLSEEFSSDDVDDISEILDDDDLTAVCIPARTIQTTTLRTCLWNGLPGLHVRDCLSQYAEYAGNTRVSFLFQEILKLEDAGYWTYLDELTHLQKRIPARQMNFESICAIYAELLVTTGEAWEDVRNAFEKDKLIFLPGEPTWVASKSCVWADAPNVGGQYGIGAVYPDLTDLFRGKLHIQAPTIATYIEQLRLLTAEGNPGRIVEIKRTINCINDLKPTADSLEGMMQLPCLPVRVPGSNITLMSPSEVFFVADRREYRKLFEGKVPILECSLEEIHALYPFLNALGLTDRYMSVAARETTKVQRPSETPSKELSQAFRAKSEAFYRCALHYRSTKVQPDGQEIFHKLRHALVYESDGFTKDLQLSYGNLTVNAASDRGTFHLEDKNGILNLFVPRNNAQREKCYLTQLPNDLQQYLQLEDNGPEASKAFLLVIHASIHVLDDILDDNGIVQILDNDLTAYEQEEEGSDAFDVEEHINLPTEQSDSPSYEEPLSEGQADIDNHIYTPSTSEEVHSVTSHSRSSTPYIAVHRTTEHIHRRSLNAGVGDLPPAPLPAEQSQYVWILDKVIEIAQRTNIPSKLAGQRAAVAATTYGLTSEEHTSAFGSRFQNQQAHDVRIGAAGELFVFELLSHLNLPDFSHDNWKSTIRKEVTVHQAYADLEPWTGAEIADIVYHDSAKTLTQILMDNGYLPRLPLLFQRPRYLIEVKSTTGACDNAFFISKSQYRLMQEHTFDPLNIKPPEVNTIYMIFRVYNLGTDNMRLRIYMNPDVLRRRNVLRFTPESYSVTHVHDSEDME
ncbi:hypothetical protein EYB26_003920 [Talaromyces marneffei]|uniref:uncharacterized protein n=1 Tax=Talaromyces marneffei TaxID=37727 RepID=UPI0012A9095E|nr:uncharacterized protein EYB26_003920 [Talaromyces marneffei]QGA16253.1 hypothetical protein EYB26_003920 [Talaromyces marneffei]